MIKNIKYRVIIENEANLEFGDGEEIDVDEDSVPSLIKNLDK